MSQSVGGKLAAEAKTLEDITDDSALSAFNSLPRTVVKTFVNSVEKVVVQVSFRLE